MSSRFFWDMLQNFSNSTIETRHGLSALMAVSNKIDLKIIAPPVDHNGGLWDVVTGEEVDVQRPDAHVLRDRQGSQGTIEHSETTTFWKINETLRISPRVLFL